jgi:hypothetical protein
MTETSVEPQGGKVMFVYRAPVLAACLALMAFGPAYGQDKKEWCTDAHMKLMDADVAKMTDAAKQKSAKMHLDMSKAEMKKNNTAECIKHMEEAHAAMGM